MLERAAIMIVAAAVLAFPASSAFAAPRPNADGMLPEEACFAQYPAVAQPLLCGRATGGPGAG